MLGYSGGELDAVGSADASGYARLERGETIVIADIGSPPPLEVATEAQAGALSFEMTSRARLVFVNGGFPGPADSDWNSVARATASHNTLCLAETSSSRLVRHAKLEGIVGGLPIRGPDMVAARLSDEGGKAVLAGSHDGYLQRFGLMHFRRIELSLNGEVVDGMDRLEPPQGSLRLKVDLPYAIHFHLHPDCKCQRLPGHEGCRITVNDGQVWQFTADGADMTIEDGLYFVDSAGPRPALQIVLRGATFGESEVRWRIALTPPDTAAETSKV